MRFLLDESVELRLGRFLRSLGHDVTAIVRDYARSISDIDVLAVAYSEKRVLITNDKDFTFLVFNQLRPHAGVILFRLGRGATITEKANSLQLILTHHQSDLDAFITIHQEGLISVRRTPLPGDERV
jgi:predicted nuclease of predicted toxin-antitoxin system